MMKKNQIKQWGEMNILKQRKKEKAICSMCQSPDYKYLSPPFKKGKPTFKCNSCGNSWQYGSGGKYLRLREVKFNKSEQR